MVFRPGTHRTLAEYRENDSDWPAGPARVAPVPMADLPPLPYSEPAFLTARAGQVSVLTTAAVHGASVNVDSEPRHNLVLTFTARGVRIGLPDGEEAQKREYHRGLRAVMRPDRARRILPSVPG